MVKAESRGMRVLAASLMLVLLAVAPSASGSPSPSTHYYSLINTTHLDPEDMTVIVVPPGYVSPSAMYPVNWVLVDPIGENPGVQATLEAIDYWAWAVGDAVSDHSQLAYLTWTTKVLGVDATIADLAGADIVVNTAMTTDTPFIFHLGLGLPTLPWQTLLLANTYMTHCTVWNTGVGSETSDNDPIRLRNLVVHEFGHCLAVGHTGTSLGLAHCDSAGDCYSPPADDVMSQVVGDERQCISNLNIQSLAEGYAWAPGTWAPHDGETYMDKDDYALSCMPTSMNRF